MSIFLFIILGFCAQLIDGCLGMAYGVFLTTILMAQGFPLVIASSSIHFSEIFTTFASAVSHWKFKNIDFHMFKKLTIAGVIGGVIGAYILTSVKGDSLKPFVAIYLLLLGIRILLKIRKDFEFKNICNHLSPLGAIGGFFDAIGGGGWGPIVTSSLIVKGNEPAKTIGTVNSAEFFVTLAQSLTFFTFIGIKNIEMTIGLIIGGVIAAPIAAILCKKINKKILMLLVAFVIIITNCYALYSIWCK